MSTASAAPRSGAGAAAAAGPARRKRRPAAAAAGVAVAIAAAALLALGGLCLPGGASRAAWPEWLSGRKPPNVLVILADDLGYADVGFHGAADLRTPNLDRLAREGIVFSNGYAAHATGGPSRAALLTGRYPARFGMDGNFAYAPADPHHGLPAAEKVLAAYLAESGYRTGMVGKWHLGAAGPFHPLNRGFESYYGFLGGGHDYFRIDATRSSIDPEDAAANELLVPLGQDRGMTGFTGYLTDRLTDAAIRFVDADRERPFFLYLSYNAPRAPLQAPPELVRKYFRIEGPRRRYLAMVDSLDRNVGRLVEALRSSGRWDETLTFFLGDNGGDPRWADNGPLREGKDSFYEGGLRVPFVAAWPAAWPRGGTFEPMVSALDVAATALAAAGVEADRERPLDGVDLGPFVRGAAPGPPHEALFWREQRSPGVGFAVRAGGMKLLAPRPGEEMALFDLRSDPGETRDRVREDPAAVRRLSGLWNRWNRGNGSRVYPPASVYVSGIGRYMRESHERALAGAANEERAFRIGKREPARRQSSSPPPQAPSGLKAIPGGRLVRLSWDDTEESGLDYQIRLMQVGSDPGWRDWRRQKWKYIQRLSRKRLGAKLWALTKGATYRVQLRAGRDGVWGPPGEVEVTFAP